MVAETTQVFPWKTEYCVGHPVIDAQHQKLVMLVNKLYSAMLDGHGKELISSVLTELVEYTKVHFAYEEQQMQAVNYPGLARHRILHLRFVEQVKEFVTRTAVRQLNAIELAAFLRDWLLIHIAQCDRPLSAHLAGNAF